MSEPIDASTLAEAGRLAAAIQAEVGRAYLGDPEPVEVVLAALLARGHVLLEGVPGVAKTTLVKAVATGLGCSYRRIQFTPDLLPSDITGTHVLEGGAFTLREGPVFTQVLLGDEINRAPAKTQAALLEAMQERQVTVEGITRPLPAPFFVLATQNPVEHEGTYPLPEAQLDRFLAKVHLGYPPPAAEREMLRRYAGGGPAPQPGSALDPATVIGLQGIADRVHVADELYDYALRLATHTRAHRRVLLGASPRAILQLVQGAKARALLRGRDHMLPDDLKHLAPYVLAHRVRVHAEAELEGLDGRVIVREALDRVPHRGAAGGAG